MVIWKSLKGQGWVCKFLRCGQRRGRGVLCLFLAGAFFCLLIPALTPHPNPAEAHRPLRRIHQEEEDYTGSKVVLQGLSKSSPLLPKTNDLQEQAEVLLNGDTLVSGSAVTTDAPTSHQPAAALQSQSQSTAAVTQKTAVFPKLEQDPTRDHRNKIQLAMAQETAFNAMQHGYKLTQIQKKLLEDLSPKARKELEDRVVKTRQAQDRVYLTHLRTRHQVVPLPGGGEKIISMANRTIRFPVMLKKSPVTEWPEQYKLYYNLTHYPWVRSRRCQNFSITFKLPGSLPARGLASFPSSGNTWVRYLIEGASGIFTGSMYADTSLMMKGMYGEGVMHNSGMTIMQKSHGYTTGEAMTMEDRQQRAQHNHLQELGYRGVVVVRNPFKALISHRHLDVGGHTGFAPKAHFLGQGWADFVRLKVRLWRDFYEDWARLTSPPDIHITHYENVRDDPVGEMRAILDYLQIPQDDARLKCLGENLDGLFKRKQRKNFHLDFNPFTEELRKVIYEAIDTVDVALKERGKPGLPLDKYEIYDTEEAVATARL